MKSPSFIEKTTKFYTSLLWKKSLELFFVDMSKKSRLGFEEKMFAWFSSNQIIDNQWNSTLKLYNLSRMFSELMAKATD